MTVDKAIEILQSHRVIPHVIFGNTEEDTKYNLENRQAIEMAIYALNQLKESESK